MYSDKLIYGRDTTENIVSLEVIDEKVILFKENGGVITTEEREYYPWLITVDNLAPSRAVKLAGEQPYKWFTSFANIEKWKDAKTLLYRKQTDFYCVNNLKEQYMIRNGITYFKGMKPKDISVVSFDIETSGLTLDSTSMVFCITNVFRNSNGIVEKHFFLDEYDNVEDMINSWCKWIREINPTIILGHNIISYDLKYLDFMSKSGLRLGRDGSKLTFNSRVRQFRKDGSQSYDYNEPHIYGREVVDTFFLSIQYDIGRSFPSYGLKSIIKHLGLEKDGRVFVDTSKIKYYYDNEPEMWERVKEYAIADVEDSLKLFDLMIPSKIFFTQHISKSFQEMCLSATGSQINNFLVRGYLQDDHSVAKAEEITESIQGGISFAVPGVYKNLYKVDLKSCYPSQVLRFKLYDKTKDPDALFYRMVHHFANKRFEYKIKFKETNDHYWKEMDAVSKIFINSAYGVCTTNGLNYNCRWIGAKITEESRNIINLALSWASGYDSVHWFKIFREKTGKETDELEENDESP